MATMIVKHKVADYNTWKTVFDEMKHDRAAHGWIGHEVHRDATDSNTVVIINKMKTLDGAKAYGASPELHIAMQKAGVISAPEIQFLNDEELVSY
jgi:heme-degrading monooxygenase HmoA